MKIIEEQVIKVEYYQNHIPKTAYIVADTYEEALEICKEQFKGLKLFSLTSISTPVYRKSTKTIEVSI